MEQIRKPFQGIWNIIRFNWHFYLASVCFILIILVMNEFFNKPYHVLGKVICILIIVATIVSLLVSFYVYDLSDLYKLDWLNELRIEANSKIVNINAGFDETSVLLAYRFPNAELFVFDFYNSDKHTEISIKRARKAYPPFLNTQQVSTSHLPLPNNFSDKIFILLSAHEIRNECERNIFFGELERILKQKGQIIVTEHLRDMPNFIAYNIGFFHFMKKSSWYRTFKNANLIVVKEKKITPFITTFILEKNGITS